MPGLTDQQVGFVGLGNMGGRMVGRLLGAGTPVLGFDTDPARAAATGAAPADSVGQVARDSDVVLLSLPDSAVVESVVLGAGGLRESGRSGQILVDLSTAAPDSTVRIHDALTERGIEYLDAGVSGGAAAAEAGTLTLMVGGSEDALAKVRPLFDPIARTIVHMGQSGSGHTTKALNNFLNAISLAATAEVMVAAKRAGLDLRQVLEVVNASSGVNFATLNRFPHIIEGDYLTGGLTNALMMKDISLYVECLATLGVPSLSAAGPLAAFGLAMRLGYADQISNRVVDAIGDVAGGVRLHEPEG